MCPTETRSLAAASARRIVILTLLAQVLTLTFTTWLILMPVVRLSIGDLSTILLIAIDIWEQTPSEHRAELRHSLQERYGLTIQERPAAEGTPSRLPYLVLLGDELSKRLDQSLTIRDAGQTGYWVDIDSGGHNLRVGFARERIGTSPLLALLAVFLVGITTSVAGALWIARSIKKPLADIASGMQEMQRGSQPIPLPEDGPEEVAELAGRFNRMAAEVHANIENRTIMLAGISHDLRTPLARLRMALEMLRGTARDPAYLNKMENYVTDMNTVIEGYLEFARLTLSREEKSIALDTEIREAVQRWQNDNAPVSLVQGDPVQIKADRFAVARMLDNLIDNALHYSEYQNVEVALLRKPAGATIEIRDRGPGIPESVREAITRPFVRLDAARSPRDQGAGLGTAIVTEIARLHGWHFTFEDRPGGGLVAMINIPGEQLSQHP